MTYEEAVQELVRAADDAGSPLILETPDGDVQSRPDIFGDALAGDIRKIGYPAEADMAWVAEDLTLFGLADLEDQQAGYRTDARNGQVSSGWDQDRYVIASWTANPISLGKDGAISYSRHGQGSWTYQRIAADLPQFFALLAAWLRYFAVERGGSIMDPDFEVDEDGRTQALDIARQIAVDDAEKAARFLLGEL